MHPVAQVRQLERAVEQGRGSRPSPLSARPGEPLPNPVSGGPYVSVVGSGAPSVELYEEARQVGRLVAERGGTVVCGGRYGVMEAAARGASEAGGVAIGVLPDEDRRKANEFLSF